MKYQITGGAGPYEAAAIVAAIAQIVEEQAAAAAKPSPRPQQTAWVNAVWTERELGEDDPSGWLVPD